MAIIDKAIEFFISKICPFIILGCGIYVGYLIGSLWCLFNSMNHPIPKIIGSIIGFVIFGIIAREAWVDMNDVKEKEDVE